LPPKAAKYFLHNLRREQELLYNPKALYYSRLVFQNPQYTACAMKKFKQWLVLGAILLAGFSCSTPAQNARVMNEQKLPFDWQGHRGARGLSPENTIPAFLKALEFPAVRTLELDLAVSADGYLVVSHEPWMSSAICSHPDGKPVQEAEEEGLAIYQMPYERIQGFDCGSRGNVRFPEQMRQMAFKPTLDAVVKEVQQYCEERGREIPFFNIEIKSTPEWDGAKSPAPEVFARLVADKLQELDIAGITTIQSFDPRPLQFLHRNDPGLTLAFLVENTQSIEENLRVLGFVPAIYSPYFGLINREAIEWAHGKGMRVIPWTVNTTNDMQRLLEWGVDGIITDYPNRIPILPPSAAK
jgi:glycerophosphoryl diester phosphodiesterase